MIKREVVIINNKEYAFGQIGVFEKSELFAKMQAIVLPALKNVKFEGNSNSDTALAMFGAISQCITEKELNGVKNTTILWNFTKFLVDENGKLIDSFISTTKPTDDAITKYLK